MQTEPFQIQYESKSVLMLGRTLLGTMVITIGTLWVAAATYLR